LPQGDASRNPLFCRDEVCSAQGVADPRWPAPEFGTHCGRFHGCGSACGVRRSAATPSRSSGASRRCPVPTGYAAARIGRCADLIIGATAWGRVLAAARPPPAGRCGSVAELGTAGASGAEQAAKRSADDAREYARRLRSLPVDQVIGMSCPACSMPPRRSWAGETPVADRHDRRGTRARAALPAWRVEPRRSPITAIALASSTVGTLSVPFHLNGIPTGARAR
jgi:hypothetical protein